MLTALTCFLVGVAVVEGRHLTGALPVVPPAGVAVSYEIVYAPPATVAPTPTPCDRTGPAAPRFGCTGNA